MSGRRYLIVNADDFGLSRGVNRGIIEAHEHGIVTSASLMVHWPAAAEAAAYGREHPGFSLGLHVDLGEWAYRDGTWVPLYEVVSLDDVTAVKAAVLRQLAAFRRLTGKDPTHVDSHQHVHLSEPVHSLVVELAARLAIPLRQCSTSVHYCGDFYGQTEDGAPFPEGITVDGLIEALNRLPLGFTELACHPGEGDDLDTMYRSERAAEVKTLCHPLIRVALADRGIELRSFASVITPRQTPSHRTLVEETP